VISDDDLRNSLGSMSLIFKGWPDASAKIGARCSEVFDAYYDPVVVNTQVAVLRDYARHSVCSGTK
jgi:hypothetical protein